jgi:predicted CXXCH cytochrome family protein
MQEFCNACHGDAAPGASTNVVAGVFDSGPSGSSGQGIGADNGGVTVAYQTASSFDATLNGGGFSEVGGVATTSMHDMEQGTATDPMWGAGSSAPAGKNLTCTDCHDPHGSSNYRLLKDLVNTHAVGGYDSNDIPAPFVVSRETGYPTGGWLKHDAGAAQMVAYRPNYTSPIYAYQPPAIPGGGGDPEFRSMSTWCSACHEQYDNKTSAYSYGADEPAIANGQVRHRHPVNTTLAAGVGPGRALQAEVKLDSKLPLEVRLNSPNAQGVWDTDDYIGCLTCHRAHGSEASMTGWAQASLNASAYPVRDNSGGVDPNHTSALLRADNRGVCERCHNK